MNREHRGILVGMTLGDGHLNVRKRKQKGKYEYESSELRIVHAIKQKDYLSHKAELVRKIFGGKHSVRDFTHAPPAAKGRSYKMCGFSKSHKYFKTLKSMMYPCGIKTYTRRVLDMLTPEGIALWYCDDGSAARNFNKKGWVSSVSTLIATQCSKIEAETICDYFLETYSIQFRLAFDKRCVEGKQYYIRANTYESKRFVKLIEKYIPDSMRYKLSHVSDLNLQECRAPKTQCLSCDADVYGNRRKGLCCKCYHRQLEKR